jgi:D-glucosaminate-6-phosphate ammonia-lyase
MNEAAARVIAEINGAEAGYVTSGAAAALVLATAACITGPDRGKSTACPIRVE